MRSGPDSWTPFCLRKPGLPALVQMLCVHAALARKSNQEQMPQQVTQRNHTIALVKNSSGLETHKLITGSTQAQIGYCLPSSPAHLTG